ncbi:hypothetical protein C8F04DRAFT_1146388, partial [Mycena alexandri]
MKPWVAGTILVMTGFVVWLFLSAINRLCISATHFRVFTLRSSDCSWRLAARRVAEGLLGESFALVSTTLIVESAPASTSTRWARRSAILLLTRETATQTKETNMVTPSKIPRPTRGEERRACGTGGAEGREGILSAVGRGGRRQGEGDVQSGTGENFLRLSAGVHFFV